MGKSIERLAQLIAETRWEHLPEPVWHHAKLVLLDTVGVMLAGSEQPEVRELRARLLASGGHGATVYACTGPQSDPRTAALLNGIAGRSIELCEGHRYVSCQAAIQIVPTVLALGEQAQSSGREMLLALILGYDVAVRFGAAMTAHTLAHQNGQAPLLGAIAAGARLRGLTATETSRALRIGATLILTPSYTNAVAGATALNVAGGMSGFAGALAPELALAGFTAQDQALEEALSQLVGTGFQPEPLEDALGERWEITRNYFRLRACCNPIYAALDAVEMALADLRPAPQDIASIEVATYRFASVMRNPAPPNTFAARYSLPHAAASLAVLGHAGYEAFSETMLTDPRIMAVRQRVQVREDPALSAQVPERKPARVTIRLRDGRQSTRTCDSARGDYLQPYDPADLRGKFQSLARLVLTAEGVRAVETTLMQLEHSASVHAVTDLLQRHCLPEAKR